MTTSTGPTTSDVAVVQGDVGQSLETVTKPLSAVEATPWMVTTDG